MTFLTDRRLINRPYYPAGLGVVAATIVSTAGWLLTVVSLIGFIMFIPDVGWAETGYLVVLCGAPQAAIWAARQALTSKRLQTMVSTTFDGRRLHGNLDAIPDDDNRALRPIGMAAADLLARTGAMLTALVDRPGVHVFHGIRTRTPRPMVVAHMVSAGRVLILVESVAWPPGRYELDAQNRVLCDGVYIGQSVHQLLSAIQHWRGTLPYGHRVTALVAVHTAGAGRWVLPAARPGLEWTSSDDLLAQIGQRLPRRPSPSVHALAALAAAT